MAGSATSLQGLALCVHAVPHATSSSLFELLASVLQLLVHSHGQQGLHLFITDECQQSFLNWAVSWLGMRSRAAGYNTACKPFKLEPPSGEL